MTDVASFAAVDACWICGGADLAAFHQARFDLSAYRREDPELAAYTGAAVHLRRCPDCGFAQPDRVPALPRFFERMYGQQWSDDWIAAEFEGSYKDLIFRRVLGLLQARAANGNRRLLDVGSHAGRFLFMARSAGWMPEGVEVNARTAAFAARRTGETVHRISASELHRLGREYDAITLIDVLEHIPAPMSLLTEVRSLLAPGGWIAVKVPCGPGQRAKEGARARLRSGYAPRLADNLVHVSHFSPRSLRLALERAGFGSIHLEVGAPECPPGRPWTNALRRVIYRAGRSVPFGIHTPLALNLQACAQKRSE